jgi:hypothetical protein
MTNMSCREREGVRLKSSAIVYPYCLQFEQAIEKRPLWDPPVQKVMPHKRHSYTCPLEGV